MTLIKACPIRCRKEPISDRVFSGSLATELISGSFELKDIYRLICCHTVESTAVD